MEERTMDEHPGSTARVRLVFADRGTFHAETVEVPAAVLDRYERLVDVLREEESVTRHLFVDMARLVSAYLVEEPG
jgi:hypothetical protein